MLYRKVRTPISDEQIQEALRRIRFDPVSSVPADYDQGEIEEAVEMLGWSKIADDDEHHIHTVAEACWRYGAQWLSTFLWMGLWGKVADDRKCPPARFTGGGSHA